MIQIQPLNVNLSDAARILGIGRTTLYSLLKYKEISSFKIGRRRVVPLQELVDFNAKRTKKHP